MHPAQPCVLQCAKSCLFPIGGSSSREVVVFICCRGKSCVVVPERRTHSDLVGCLQFSRAWNYPFHLLPLTGTEFRHCWKDPDFWQPRCTSTKMTGLGTTTVSEIPNSVLLVAKWDSNRGTTPPIMWEGRRPGESKVSGSALAVWTRSTVKQSLVGSNPR